MKNNTQNLMEKIALLLQEEQGTDDSAFVRESLNRINSRLDNLEKQLTVRSRESGVESPQVGHPSLEKLNFIEEMVDEIIHNHQITKACLFEKNKPCDHCSMCNSRGF